ncbi:MAG: cytidine deaminase [Coriobacteriaceae bacterium]|nr:cytidine deaminase [Coriobacteriaceae bacterium]
MRASEERTRDRKESPLTDIELVRAAIAARENAYAPYSHFAVGAALLCADGTVYGGCNIENAAYSPGNCAERTAIFRAMFDGHRDFAAIAVVGGPEGEPISELCAPCGVCRQVMREFCDPATFRILMGISEDSFIEATLAELLPHGFGPQNLGK